MRVSCRVGALAVALGVGVAVVTGAGLGLGLARADDTDTGQQDPQDQPTDPGDDGEDSASTEPGPPDPPAPPESISPDQGQDDERDDDLSDPPQTGMNFNATQIDLSENDEKLEENEEEEQRVVETEEDEDGQEGVDGLGAHQTPNALAVATAPPIPPADPPPPPDEQKTADGNDPQALHDPSEALNEPTGDGEPVMLRLAMPLDEPDAMVMSLMAATGTPAPAPLQPQPAGLIDAVMGTPIALANIMTTAVNTLLSSILAPGPTTPAPPAMLFIVLGWVQREMQRTFFNQSPTGVIDEVTTSENTDITITPLGNDTDGDLGAGDVLTITDYTQPANGSVALNPDGTFTYTPNTDFTGTDSFDYTVSDEASSWHIHGLAGFFSGGEHSSTTTVTISVINTNDAPVAVDDTYAATEDLPLNAGGFLQQPNLLANDTDVDGPALSTLAEAKATAKGGTVAINTDGTFTYQSALNYDNSIDGPDSFTYTVTDGTNNTKGTASVNVFAVNDAPVAVGDSATVTEDTATPITVLANDTDVDSTTLTPVMVGQGTKGTATVNGDGTITYTPNLDATGADSFTYKINDGATDSSTATVTIAITAVNDAPVAGDDGPFTTAEDTELIISPATLLSNDTDVDGTASLSEVFSINGGTVEYAAGVITFTPAENFTGPASFGYIVTDGNDGFDTATVTIDVTPVNDNPTAANDFLDNINEDTTVIIDSATLLANDTDVDNAPSALSISSVSTTNGTVSLNTTTGEITYTPAENFSGEAGFEYTVTDGVGGSDTATAFINADPVNDPPVADADAYSTNEDNPLTVTAPGVRDGDSDVDSTIVSTAVTNNVDDGTLTLNNDGSFTYTPDLNFNGTDSFEYTVTDNQGGVSASATVTITVNAVNDAPVADDHSATITEDQSTTFTVVNANSDADHAANTLSVTTTATAAQGIATYNSATGELTYIPNAQGLDTGESRVDTFDYTVTDPQGGSATREVTVTVTGVDDAPVATGDSFTTDQDTTVTGTLPPPTDVDGETTLFYQIVTEPTHGSLMFNPVNGGFVYIPDAEELDAGESISDSFTYRANDGTTVGNTATMSITITGLNDAPFTVGNTLSTNEDTALTNTLGAGDVDGETLTYSIVSGPSHGTITDFNTTTGAYTYTPGAAAQSLDTGENQPDSFTFKVNDGTTDSNTSTVNITITGANDAPTAGNDSAIVIEDTPGTITVLTNDNDVDVETLTPVIVGQGAKGTAAVNPNGTITYTPNLNATGADSFTYKVSDGALDSNTATVSVSITAVNDAPANVLPGTQSATVGTPLVFSTANSNAISVSDVDADTGQMRVALDPSGTNTVTLASTNGLTFSLGDGTNDGLMQFVGTPAAINNAMNGMTFNGSAAGTASLQITTEDLGNTGTGGNKIDSDTLTINVNAPVPTFTVGDNPNEVAVSTNGAAVYVANAGSNTVSVYNTATNTVTTLPIGAGDALTNPQSLAVSGNRLYVGHTDSTGEVGQLSIYDITTATAPVRLDANGVGAGMAATGVTSPGGVTTSAIAVTGTTVYAAYTPIDVGPGAVVKYTNSADVLTVESLIGNTAGVNRPVALAVHSSRLYVVNAGNDTVTQYNTNPSNSLTGSLALAAGANPTAIAIDTAGNRAYVTNRATNTVKAFSTDNGLTSADDTAVADVASLGLGTGPTGVVYKNNRLYISTENGYLVEINTTSNVNTVVQSAPLPDHGRGIAVSPTTNKVYITGSDNVTSPSGTGSGTNDDLYVIVV